MPSSETYDVKQDSKGFIWIATDRGVARYNGYEFMVLTTNDGLPCNTVFRFVEDKQGRIWFLSFHSQLAYFYNNKIYKYTYNHVLEKHVKGTPVPQSLHVDKSGGLYIGYDGLGLMHIDAKGNYSQILGLNESVYYQFFAREIEGDLLFGSYQSPAMPNKKVGYDIKSGGREKQLIYREEEVGQGFHIASIKRRNGTLVTATTKKLVEYNPPTDKVELFPVSTTVARLYEDKDSCLWVCSIKHGTKRLTKNSSDLDNYTNHLLNGKSVTGVLHDTDGGFWFTTLENGVYYFPQFTFLRAVTPMNQKSNEVTCITGDGSQSVLVGYGKGIVEEIRSERCVNTWNLNPGRDSTLFVYALLYGGEGSNTLLCGHNRGLALVRKNKPVNILSRSICRAIGRIKKDEYIFMAHSSISKLVHGVVTQLFLPEFHLYAEDICMNNNGDVLIATGSGLYMYNAKKGLHRSGNFLSKVRVKEIDKTSDGSIYYATLGKGIVIEKNGKYTIVDEKKGMTSDFVNAIINDGDTIWAATTKGITRLILEKNRITINNFDQHNGLPTNEIKKIYKQGALVWLGTNNGLYYFNTNKIVIKKESQAVLLDQVRVNEKPAKGSQFSSDQNNFNFSFFALDYTMRGSIHYRYRLVGYDNKWKYTGNRTVSYLSLPAGQYCFEVQARNKDRYWSASTRYCFVVFKPFYLEWWFIIPVLLVLITIISLIIRKRISTIRHNNKVLLMMNEYKGIALASQINPHFIFNSLNSIQSFVILEDRMSAAKYISSFAKLMRKSLEHSRIDFVSVSDEMELLETYLALEKLRFKNKFTYGFDIDESINRETTQIPSMILQPFIENSIKHGLMTKEKMDGIVTIALKFENAMLKCEIDDNGTGRKPRPVINQEKKHISHGIDITVERIKTYCKNEKTKFHFIIEDKLDSDAKPAGTKVVFYLPYKKVAYEA
ncbi:MAG TPA: histidine kinase [Flavobacteriales bacterium]|nr:histidine kinase [Flavobacteriales bacterium]